MREFKIGNRKVGGQSPAFIVAEVSANHAQSYDLAAAIVKAAAEAGADAVKLQTYTPDTMTIRSDKEWFRVGGKDNPETWQGKTFYDLYSEAYTPWDWHESLQKLAHELGLMFFSTPFDASAVDFLETLDVPCYKIASYESTDIPLLKKVASTGKPVIISVGFATLPEVEYSVKTLRDAGARDIAVLYCTTSYAKTSEPGFANLRTIGDIRERFDVVSGFSDNIGGIETPVLSAAMGASIIEKHLVAEHDASILDDRFSLDPGEFKTMVQAIRRNELLMGGIKYGPQTPQEEYNRRFRRSLFAVEDVKKGDKFTPLNVRSIRPADGLETKHWDEVMGRSAARDIARGTPLSWDLVA